MPRMGPLPSGRNNRHFRCILQNGETDFIYRTIINGGQQCNVFVLEAKPGIERIFDFQNGCDRLGLSQALTFANLNLL